jgi:endo-1,4-beta-xylanase
MISRRSVLRSAVLTGAVSLSGAQAFAYLLRSSVPEGTEEGLRQLAARRGIVYGCAVNTTELQDDDFAGALVREAGILVPEYEMKRGVVEAVRGKLDFGPCDAILDFVKRQGMAFRGHPLVWHKRNPGWLDDSALASRDPDLLRGYIQSVIGHFRGRVHSWDVVNEAIAPGDGRKDALRNTIWLKAYGPSYVDAAFHAAREADPQAMLVYNDWGCEAGAPKNDRFRAATLDFLEQALARRTPIDALGLQGHLAAFGPQVDQRKLREFLDRVKSLGLRILVTEHDVDDSGGSTDIKVRDRAVADASRKFLDVMLDNNATSAVLTWGLSDRFLDPPSWRQRLAGYFPRMLPLDSDLQRTPMWQAMAKAFAAG